MARYNYRPRCVVSVAGTIGGEHLQFNVIPESASVTRRSHNQAASAEVEFNGSMLPFDIRDVEDLYIMLFMGSVDEFDDDVNERQYLRFVGYADEEEDSRDDGKIRLQCRDLSSLLREIKPIPKDRLPHYGMTVKEAIETILQASPSADSSLEVSDNEHSQISLGSAVDARHQSHPITMPQNCSLWEGIEHVCSLVGRLVSVRLGTILVRGATETFGGEGEPTFEFIFGRDGANTTKLNAHKKFVRNRKGIRVSCWNPQQRRLVHADYPSDTELRALRIDRPTMPTSNAPPTTRTPHRGTGHNNRVRPPAGRHGLERDVFVVHGVTQETQLAEIAQRIWRERSCQEATVKVTTPALEETAYSLENGDRVRLQLNPLLAAGLRGSSQDLAADFVARSLRISQDAARLLIRASRAPKTSAFYVRDVTLRWSSSGQSTIDAELINLIDVRTRRPQ